MVKKVDKKMFVKPKLKKAMKPDKLKSALKSDKIKSAMKPDKIMTALKPDKVKLAVKPVKVKSAMKPDKVKSAMKPDKVKKAMKPDKFKIPSPDINENKKVSFYKRSFSMIRVGLVRHGQLALFVSLNRLELSYPIDFKFCIMIPTIVRDELCHIFKQFCNKFTYNFVWTYALIFCLFSSDTLQVLVFVNMTG